MTTDCEVYRTAAVAGPVFGVMISVLCRVIRTYFIQERTMTAKPRNTQSVTITVERALLVRAREAGINLSATLSTALDAELRRHEAKKWQEENREALAALNRFHDEQGCFSDEYRTF